MHVYISGLNSESLGAVNCQSNCKSQTFPSLYSVFSHCISLFNLLLKLKLNLLLKRQNRRGQAANPSPAIHLVFEKDWTGLDSEFRIPNSELRIENRVEMGIGIGIGIQVQPTVL